MIPFTISSAKPIIIAWRFSLYSLMRRPKQLRSPHPSLAWPTNSCLLLVSGGTGFCSPHHILLSLLFVFLSTGKDALQQLRSPQELPADKGGWQVLWQVALQGELSGQPFLESLLRSGHCGCAFRVGVSARDTQAQQLRRCHASPHTSPLLLVQPQEHELHQEPQIRRLHPHHAPHAQPEEGQGAHGVIIILFLVRLLVLLVGVVVPFVVRVWAVQTQQKAIEPAVVVLVVEGRWRGVRRRVPDDDLVLRYATQGCRPAMPMKKALLHVMCVVGRLIIFQTRERLMCDRTKVKW